MLDKIKDIKNALNAKSYQSALALTLTLPAIGAEVEFGSSLRTDYKKWCDSHIPNDVFHFGFPGFEENELTGEVMYQLRCSALHAGTSDVEQKFGIKINNFSFWISENHSVNYGYEYAQKEINGVQVYDTKIDLIYLVNEVCNAAEKFYNQWPNKSDFNKHTIKIEIR